jgi:hypothetical protein
MMCGSASWRPPACMTFLQGVPSIGLVPERLGRDRLADRHRPRQVAPLDLGFQGAADVRVEQVADQGDRVADAILSRDVPAELDLVRHAGEQFGRPHGAGAAAKLDAAESGEPEFDGRTEGSTGRVGGEARRGDLAGEGFRGDGLVDRGASELLGRAGQVGQALHDAGRERARPGRTAPGFRGRGLDAPRAARPATSSANPSTPWASVRAARWPAVPPGRSPSAGNSLGILGPIRVSIAGPTKSRTSQLVGSFSLMTWGMNRPLPVMMSSHDRLWDWSSIPSVPPKGTRLRGMSSRWPDASARSWRKPILSIVPPRNPSTSRRPPGACPGGWSPRGRAAARTWAAAWAACRTC